MSTAARPWHRAPIVRCPFRFLVGLGAAVVLCLVLAGLALADIVDMDGPQ